MEVMYGKSISYWYRRREDGTGPSFHPLGGRSILYRKDLVEAWLENLRVTGFDDPKYAEIVEKRRKAKAKRLKASASSIRKPIEFEPPRGIPLIHRGTCIQTSERPHVFRFLPNANRKADQMEHSAAQCAKAWLLSHQTA